MCRRMAAWLLTLCVVLGAAALAQAETAAGEGSALSTRSEDGLVCFADEEGIHFGGTGGGSVLVRALKNVSAVDLLDGEIYAACAQSEGEAVILHMDQSGDILQDWIVPVRGEVCGLLAFAEKIVYLSGANQEADLFILDRKTGAIIAGQEGQIGELARDGEGAAVAMQPMQNRLLRIDITDGSAQVLCEGSEAARIMALYADSDSSATEQGGLSPGALWPANAQETEQITIWQSEFVSPDERMNAAAGLFAQQHPQARLLFTQGETEDLVLSLMSGEQACDIFWLMYLEQPTFERAGLFADLGAYPAVTEALEDWLHVGAMYDAQGTLRCIPTELQEIWLWYQIEPSMFDESGISLPKGGNTYETAGELFSQARGKGFYFLGDRDDLQYPFIHHLTRLAGNGLRYEFDTLQYRKMLSFWKMTYIAGETVFSEQLRTETRSNVLMTPFTKAFGAKIDPLAWITAGDFMFMPSAEGEAFAPVEMNALFLYEYGGNKPLAADFLGCYASAEAQGVLAWPSCNLFLKELSAYGQHEIWTQVIPQLEYRQVDADGYALWADVMEHTCQMPGDGELYTTANEMHRKYLQGEVEADDVIAALNKKTDILLNE